MFVEVYVVKGVISLWGDRCTCPASPVIMNLIKVKQFACTFRVCYTRAFVAYCDFVMLENVFVAAMAWFLIGLSENYHGTPGGHSAWGVKLPGLAKAPW